jgi:hypothetical protein
MNRKFDTSRLAIQTDPAQVGKGVFACISQLQHLETTEQQVSAAAVLLLMYCHQINAHVGSVLNVANNIIDRTVHMTPELKGSLDYVKHEL